MNRVAIQRMVMPGVAALVFAVACGGGVGTRPATTTSSAQARGKIQSGSVTQSAKAQRVDLRLPFLVAGYDAPFLLAKEAGDYSKVGFDVNVREGKGSVTSVETVANGSDTFGFVDASVAAKLISKGAPVRIIAVFVQKTPMGFLHAPDVNATAAASIKGRTFIGVAGSSNVEILPAVLKKMGLPPTDVHLSIVSPRAETVTFNKHRTDVLLGDVNVNYPVVQSIWHHVAFTSYGQFGINLYTFSLITTNAEIRQHPKLVRRFVTASVEGWQAAVKDPRAAVAATKRIFPRAKSTLIAKQLRNTLPLLHSRATQGKMLGWSAKSDWQTMLQVLHKYTGLRTIKPLGDYYTNRFLPQ